MPFLLSAGLEQILARFLKPLLISSHKVTSNLGGLDAPLKIGKMKCKNNFRNSLPTFYTKTANNAHYCPVVKVLSS